MGQMEMKCMFNIGKNISILAKATQVSDVAHGPLVLNKWAKHHGQKSVFVGTHREVLSQETLM
jgi:hypothetical protein